MSVLHQKPHAVSVTPQGVLWMLVWALFFTAGMSFAKLLSPHIHTFLIVFIRLCFGAIFVLPFIIKGESRPLKTRRFPLHLFRALCTCGSMMCTYYAYTHLPLTTATSIGFLQPILVAFLSFMFLGDRLTFLQWGIICLGYAGVLVMVRPGIEGIEPAILVALGANALASLSVIFVKKLSRTESAAQILFYFHGLGIFIMGGLSFMFWHPLALRDWGLLGIIGLCASSAQFFLVKAMTQGDPSALSSFEYTRLVIAIPVGMILFEETPTFWGIFGGVVIIFSNLLMTYSTARLKKKSQIIKKKPQTMASPSLEKKTIQRP